MNRLCRIIAFCFCAGGIAFGAETELQPPAPTELGIGERAFAAGDYDGAWRAFRTLKARSELEANPVWRGQALRGLAACALRFAEADRLEQLIAEFGDRDSAADQRLRRFLEGELALLRRQPREAEAIFDELAAGAGPMPESFARQLLSEQGRVKLALGKYAEAAEIYAALEKTAGDDFWRDEAAVKKIYAGLKGGDLTAARETIARLSGDAKTSDGLRRSLEELRLLALLAEERYDEFDAAYAKLPPVEPGAADDLRYEIATSAAENHLKNRRPAEAVAYWRDAFASASNAEWQEIAARRTINALIAAGELEEALQATDKYLALFPGVAGESEMRLSRPRLLMSMKREDDALAEYESLLADANLAAADWRLAAKEAARIYRARRRDGDVSRILELLRDRSAGADERQEAEFLLAEHRFAAGDHAGAAADFTRLTTEPGQYRQRSYYWALRSYLELGEWSAALGMATTLSAMNEASDRLRAAGYYYRGMLLDKLGRNADAMAAYDLGAKEFPASGPAADSRYLAAELAWRSGDYRRATQWFEEAARLARQNVAADEPDRMPLAPETPPAELAALALYQAVRAACYADMPETMDRNLELLKSDYPDSDRTADALFWHVDYLKGVGAREMAQAGLAEMADFYRTAAPKRLPAVWYDQAQLLCDEDVAGTLELLARLGRDYPDDPLAAQAWFLTGDLLSRDAKFEEARQAYRTALAGKGDAVFHWAAEGRIADCAYQIYAATRRAEELAMAREIYRELLTHEDLPAAMRAQTLCRLGRACEAGEEPEEALEMYNQLLYGAAAELESAGRISGAPWVARGGYAAIKVCLNLGGQERARQALALIGVMRELRLDSGEDFRELETMVRNRFRI